MQKRNRDFQVGDQVVHWEYGLGEITQLDEKELSGQTRQYYVIQIREMTMWIPLDFAAEHSLRFLTSAENFQQLFRLLAAPAEPLADQRFERKNQVSERLQDGTIESICRVVRDLTARKRIKKMNDYDNNFLGRARDFLLIEWCVVLSVSLQQAERKLEELLGGN
jgi:CarD family transcriptional regulator